MENLLNELISKLTGLESSNLDCRKIYNKAKYTLKYTKCTSTSEKEVNDSLDGLAEKFTIKGRPELSSALLTSKQELLSPLNVLGSLDSNQVILKYDMIKLLLCLSAAIPPRHPIYDRRDVLRKPDITWEDIAREEPLIGDHWKSWSEDDNSADIISDEEAFEVEQSTPETVSHETSIIDQEKTVDSSYQKTADVNFFERLELDDCNELDVVNHLAMQQYWGSDFSFASGNSSNHPLLHSPYSLNIVRSESIIKEQQQVIKESDVIREVLFLLRGLDGILFVYDKHNSRFSLKNENFTVRHLSQGALNFLLNELCNYGTILSNLRSLISYILSDTMSCGQTAQAFATVIYKSLSEFEGELSVFEADSGFITKDPTKTISILKLKTEIETPLLCFQEIYNVVEHVPFREGAPRSITYKLLSALYESALDRQICGQHSLYKALFYVFQKTVVPFGQLMDDWTLRGSLEGDRLKEFYVSRNEGIHVKDSDFWIKGFSLQAPSTNTSGFHCPIFEKRIMERIFFIGKAVNLSLQITNTKDEEVCMEQTPTLFHSFFEKSLPLKCPFVRTAKSESINNTRRAYDLFTQSLFPMTNIPKTLLSNSFCLRDHNEDVHLFDQNLIQCMEHYIQIPYNNMAKRLNAILHNNCGLSAQLKYLSQVYLMLENDMMSTFCYTLFTRIDNKENWFDKRSLNSMFIEACKTNGYDGSDFFEIEVVHLKNRLNTSTINTTSSVLQSIRFKMSILWPLNNFVQEGILKQYSEITKLLLCLRRAKHTLEKKIRYNNKWKYKEDHPIFAWFYSIRMKMLWFVNTLCQYIMVAVLHAETIKFRESIYNSTDVDEIIVFHTIYIRRLMEKCLLDEKSTSIRIAVFKVTNAAETLADMFSKHMYKEKLITTGFYQQCDSEDFTSSMKLAESEFTNTCQFIVNGLLSLSQEAGLLWCEALATSLRAEQFFTE
ncbi:Spc98 family-domain-containing protein [Sporodiniella umbellata]|nr:Spc98 family-domain-containing protein [Sporodiniella umbellata]